MDKLGPICRSVEDAALVMQAIHGPDGHDASVRPASFAWDDSMDLKTLRIGYLESAFAEPGQAGPSASLRRTKCWGDLVKTQTDVPAHNSRTQRVPG